MLSTSFQYGQLTDFLPVDAGGGSPGGRPGGCGNQCWSPWSCLNSVDPSPQSWRPSLFLGPSFGNGSGLPLKGLVCAFIHERAAAPACSVGSGQCPWRKCWRPRAAPPLHPGERPCSAMGRSPLRALLNYWLVFCRGLRTDVHTGRCLFLYCLRPALASG